MNKTLSFYQNIFSVFGLVFYTSTLKFDSLFSAYSGVAGTYVIVRQPLARLLSLTQHSIFLIAVFFIVINYKDAVRAFTRNIFLWILVGMVLISFLWSDFPAVSQPRSLSFLETSLFGVYLASSYDLKTQVRLFAWALAISVLINIFFTGIQPKHGIDWVTHPGAWRGVFVQKNLLARLAVLGSVIFLIVEPKPNEFNNRFASIGSKLKYLPWLFLFLSIALVVLSQSKSALLIAVLIIFSLLVLKIFSFSDLVAIPIVLAFLIIVGSAIAGLVINLDVILSAMDKDITLSGRTIIWSALFDKIQERPVLGYGYLGFWHGMYGNSAYVGKVMGNTYTPPHAHNGFIELVLAFGYVGAAFFSLSFFLVIRRAIIAARLKNVSEELFPLLYLIFLTFYNLIEPTLIEHNSIFWVLYVSLASTRFLDFKEFNREKTEFFNGLQQPKLTLEEK